MRYPWPGYGYGLNDGCSHNPSNYLIVMVDYNYKYDLYCNVIKKNLSSEKFLLGHYGIEWKDRC